MIYQEHFSVVSFLMVALTAVLSCSVLAALPHFHQIAFFPSQTPLNYCKLLKWQSPALQPGVQSLHLPLSVAHCIWNNLNTNKPTEQYCPNCHTQEQFYCCTPGQEFHGHICARQIQDRKGALHKLLSGWVIKTTTFLCISFHFIVAKMTSKGGWRKGTKTGMDGLQFPLLRVKNLTEERCERPRFNILQVRDELYILIIFYFKGSTRHQIFTKIQDSLKEFADQH